MSGQHGAAGPDWYDGVLVRDGVTVHAAVYEVGAETAMAAELGDALMRAGGVVQVTEHYGHVAGAVCPAVSVVSQRVARLHGACYRWAWAADWNGVRKVLGRREVLGGE